MFGAMAMGIASAVVEAKTRHDLGLPPLQPIMLQPEPEPERKIDPSWLAFAFILGMALG